MSHKKRKSKTASQSSNTIPSSLAATDYKLSPQHQFNTGNAIYENMEHTDNIPYDTNVAYHTKSHRHYDYDYPTVFKEQVTVNEDMLINAVVPVDKNPAYDIVRYAH